MGKYEELSEKYNQSRTLNDKYEEMLRLMDQWIANLQDGKSVRCFFEIKKYKKIAVYGTSWLSRRLQQELDGTDIIVELVFDKNSIESIRDCNVDVIVVTSLYYFYEIQMALEKLTDIPIVSIGKIVFLMDYIKELR